MKFKPLTKILLLLGHTALPSLCLPSPSPPAGTTPSDSFSRAGKQGALRTMLADGLDRSRKTTGDLPDQSRPTSSENSKRDVELPGTQLDISSFWYGFQERKKICGTSYMAASPLRDAPGITVSVKDCEKVAGWFRDRARDGFWMGEHWDRGGKYATVYAENGCAMRFRHPDRENKAW